MNAEQLTVIAGAILSLAFSYIPGLKTSCAAPGAEPLSPGLCAPANPCHFQETLQRRAGWLPHNWPRSRPQRLNVKNIPIAMPTTARICLYSLFVGQNDSIVPSTSRAMNTLPSPFKIVSSKWQTRS
jgi:hypothetical protein